MIEIFAIIMDNPEATFIFSSFLICLTVGFVRREF